MTYRFEADSETEAALRRMRAEAAARSQLDKERALADAKRAWAIKAAHAPIPGPVGRQQAARLQMQRRTNPGFMPEPVNTGTTATEAQRIWNAAGNLSPASGAAQARNAYLRNTRNGR